MAEFTLKGRHPISDKEAQAANDAVEAAIGVRVLPEDGEALIEKATAGDYELVLVNGEAHIVLDGPETDTPTPTLRGLMAQRPEGHGVTVDMGAIPHLRNGADVMSPGITDADPAITEGDLVWVKDIEHGAPLGIGYALIDGDAMVANDQGKAIRIWHHIADELWQLGA